MGGHRAGEVASATALEALRAAISSGRPLREAIEDANDAVFTKSLTDTVLAGMGTTLTAGTIAAGGTLILGHVGDSRAYLLHDGELRQITTDHSLVEELVATAGSPPTRPRCTRSARSSRVRSASTPSVEVDVYPVELRPAIASCSAPTASPTWCTPTTIAATLRREDDPTRAATQLVDAANAAGGEDNITVVVVAVTDEASGARPRRRAHRADRGRRRSTPNPRPRAGRTPRRASAAASGACCCGCCRSCSCSASRSAPSAGTRGNNYYVGRDQGQVTVFKGVPGGLAGWDPTVEQRTNLELADLRPADAGRRCADEQTFSSLADADAFVAPDPAARDLDHRRRPRRPPTTTTTTATTTPASRAAPATP